MITAQQILKVVEPLVFSRRPITLLLIILFTALMAWQCRLFAWDTGIQKQLPLDHPYIETLLKHQKKFGSGNVVVIGLRQQQGDIFNEPFLARLKAVHDALFFTAGVDKPSVRSLFSPGVRYLTVTEDGFFGGDVVPQKAQLDPADIPSIRQNAAIAGSAVTLLSPNNTGALIRAELLEWDPDTGEKLDYIALAQRLEEIRKQFEGEGITLHILGFPMVVGAIVDAVEEVVMFFGIAALLTGLLLWGYCASWRVAILPLGCTLVAVVWEFGLLMSFGYKLDPFAILVPFLVLAIGVSHGVQMVNGWIDEVRFDDANSVDASLNTFRRLAIPGTAALITDVFGFAAIALIDIDVIQEMAINAAFGVAAVIITNKVLMPILLSYTRIPDVPAFRAKLQAREERSEKWWWHLSVVAAPKPAAVVILAASLLAGWGFWKSQDLQVGDTQAGVPELRPDSRYNLDVAAVAEAFPQNLDVLQVMVETSPEACVEYEVMAEIDRFAWHMRNVPGVDRVHSLTEIARKVYPFREQEAQTFASLSRNPDLLAALISPAPAKIVRNADCSVMPVLLFLQDHRATTISTVTAAVERWRDQNPHHRLKFALGSGNVAILAATNDIVATQEKPILFYVYAAIILMCWLSFRRFSAILSITVPLALVSLLAYAVMATLDIGLKVATLPVVALAVGIGIDYGIYVYSVLAEKAPAAASLREAYRNTLQLTGKAVIFTGLALGISVITWLFSDLQFQRDMGKLLMFMFVGNMFGAVLLLPAIARYTLKNNR